MAVKTVAVAALALLLLAPAGASAAPPHSTDGRSPAQAREQKAPPRRNRGGVYRLEEVQITGSPEHPAILFFLPRAKVRLLPLRTENDWKREILSEGREMTEPSR